MARDQVKAKVLAISSMETANTAETKVARLNRACRQVQRNPQRKFTEVRARTDSK